MVKQAPKPILEDHAPLVAQSTAPTQHETSHIELMSEHQDLSLRELSALSRDLRGQITVLDKQRKSVDEVYHIKHQELLKLRNLARMSPEDADDVLSGRELVDVD